MTTDEFSKLIRYIEGAAHRQMWVKTREVWWMELRSYEYDDMMKAARYFVTSREAAKRFFLPLVSDVLNAHWELKRNESSVSWPEKEPITRSEAKGFLQTMRTALDKAREAWGMDRVRCVGGSEGIREDEPQEPLDETGEGVSRMEGSGPEGSKGGGPDAAS